MIEIKINKCSDWTAGSVIILHLSEIKTRDQLTNRPSNQPTDGRHDGSFVRDTIRISIWKENYCSKHFSTVIKYLFKLFVFHCNKYLYICL